MSMSETLSTPPFVLSTDGCRVINQEGVSELCGDLLLPKKEIESGSHSRLTTTFDSLLRFEAGNPRPAFAIGEYLRRFTEQCGMAFTPFAVREGESRLVPHPFPSDSAGGSTANVFAMRSATVVYEDQLNVLDLAAQIACERSNEVVYFLCSRRAQLKSLARRLEKVGCRYLLMDKKFREVPNEYFNETDLEPVIVLSTFYGVDSSHFTHANRVFFLEAAQVLHRRAAYMLTDQPDLNPCFYAFRKESAVLSPREETAVAAMFGPHEVRLGRNGDIRREMNFAFCDYRHQDQQNADRYHAFVATIAQGLAGQTVRDPQFRTVRRWIRDQPFDRPRVAVVVPLDKVAIEVSKRLPGSALATNLSSDSPVIGSLPGSNREVLAAGHRHLARGDFSFLVASAEAIHKSPDEFRPDVVVWASPSTKLPELPETWTHTRCGESSSPMLWIDIKHRRDIRRGLRRRRERIYRARDIFEVGVSGVEERVRWFWENQEEWRQEASRCR